MQAPFRNGSGTTQCPLSKRMLMIRVVSFEFNPFQENTWVLYDETGACVIADPGCYDGGEQRRLQQFIEQHELTPVLLLNTHCHLDHIFGNAFVHRQWGLAPHIHRLDLPFLERAPQISMMYGISMPEPSPPPAGWLDDGQEIEFGESRLKVLFVPGHAPGHVAFYAPEEGFVVSGDVLFYDSVGRTDLPGGDWNTLLQSIRKRMFALPDDTRVLPGHGPETTIGREKKFNPFCGLNAV